MRLLELDNNNEPSLAQDVIGDSPRYAILSHTWGKVTEEVSFQDLINGNGKGKDGYNKIRLCGEQARRDGLRYFWVDTCCIDKTNSTELSEAINSMFRWYRDAVKCYAYLPDIVGLISNTGEQDGPRLWESSFRRSKWFTRGWTLQELIAPTSVEFYSKEWERIGNKKSLERHIRDVTGIPAQALNGGALSNFSVAERLSWAETRETTREEDKAYCMMGIFDIFMPLIYGEGIDSALTRLHEQIDKASKGAHREDFSVTFSLSGVAETSHFVAREEELAEIHQNLIGDGSRHTVVLHGLGGIGKTQLSIAYAKRHRNSYSAIFWLNIKDEDTLKQSFTKAATQILRDHPSARQLMNVDVKDSDMVIDAVKAWLSLPNNSRWLMIFDNFDNPKVSGNEDPSAIDIQTFLPEAYQGSVVITTRFSQVKIGHFIPLKRLENINDGLKILSSMSNRGDLTNDPDAMKLAGRLDGLPLALATAGTYLDQVSITFLEYLRLYEDSWAKLLQTSPEISSYQDKTLYSTWDISFNHIEKCNRFSANLLRLWAYLDNQDIWFEFIHRTDSDDFKWSEVKNFEWVLQLSEDRLSFHNAMRVLSNHGLVEVQIPSLELIESKGYSIHGCVHSWTIHVLNQSWDYDLAKLAIMLVGSHTPDDEAKQTWLTQRRLLQHAARCSYIISNELVAEGDIAWACHNLGELYLHQGKFVDAEQMYQQALKENENTLGSDHESTHDTINSLGILYSIQDKSAEAETMFHLVLKGRENALGFDHISTLQAANNLGNIYQRLGKLVESENMYQRVLKGQENVLELNEGLTLDTINNLGGVYGAQGKLAEAEQLYRRALKGRENTLGIDHPSTLRTIQNLAIIYYNQGKLTEAEQLFRRSLEGYKKALGFLHLTTLEALSNLGVVYRDQGNFAQAEEMLREALQGLKKVVGPDHTLTMKTIYNLSALLVDLGKYEEAEAMCHTLLQGLKKAIGPDGVKTNLHSLLITERLGRLYERMGRPSDAQKLYTQALSGVEVVYGRSSTHYERIISALTAIQKEGGSRGAS